MVDCRLFVTSLMLLLVSHVTGAIALERPEPGQLYRVTGVTSGDSLNIRDFPAAEATIVGRFQSDDGKISVTGTTAESDGVVWWRIVLPEDLSEKAGGDGWVNSRFLKLDGEVLDSGTSPLECFGDEPFWSLIVEGSRAQYKFDQTATFQASRVITASGFKPSWHFAIRLSSSSGKTGYLTVVRAIKGACTDGMGSGRLYPFYGTVILPDGEVFGGCCQRASQKIR